MSRHTGIPFTIPLMVGLSAAYMVVKVLRDDLWWALFWAALGAVNSALWMKWKQR